MSGFVAVLALEGRPAPLDVHLLAAALPAPPPAAAHTWSAGPASFAAFHHDAPPANLHSRHSPDALVFDGRIDNRGELTGALRLERDARDEEIVTAAYEKWGDDCAAHICGDFAFALWDAHAGRMLCARDPLGVRPFYYACVAGAIVCASDLGPVLAAHGAPPRRNEGMIAEYLCDRIVSLSETVHEGVYRLPAGHVLRATRDGAVRASCYWFPGDAPRIRYRSDDEYAAHFRDIFTEAVRCRIPDDRGAAILFSGGIDSSALTVTAARVAPAACRPTAFTLTFEDCEADELPYVDDVLAACGVPGHVARVPGAATPVPPRHNRDPHDWLRDVPADMWKDSIRSRGFSVVLTGDGGDDALLGSQYHYAELLRRGRIAALVRQWRADPVVLEEPTTAGDLLRYGVWPLLPSPFRSAVNRVRRAAGPSLVPAWITNDLAARTALDSRLRPVPPPPTGDATVDDHRRAFASGLRAVQRESFTREATERGLAERYPFRDRRVVDFALAIPDEQRWSGTITRRVLRRALAPELPVSIQTRTSAGNGMWRVPRMVEALESLLRIDDLAIAEAGWVKQEAVAGMYRRMRTHAAANDTSYAADAWALFLILGTELWFRHAEHPRYTSLAT